MNLKIEYERDFDGWLSHNIHLLRQGKFAEIDAEHLIEELEDMWRGRKSELAGLFIVLIAHVRKWQFQYRQLAEQWREFEGKSWRKTIIEQRLQIDHTLEDSPSLKAYLQAAVEKAYPKAVAYAIEETGLDKSVFPAHCPYPITELLDHGFFPTAEK